MVLPGKPGGRVRRRRLFAERPVWFSQAGRSSFPVRPPKQRERLESRRVDGSLTSDREDVVVARPRSRALRAAFRDLPRVEDPEATLLEDRSAFLVELSSVGRDEKRLVAVEQLTRSAQHRCLRALHVDLQEG